MAEAQDKKVSRTEQHNTMPTVMSDDASRLVVGRAMSMSGDLTACQHLIVEGRVESHSFEAQRLDISEHGHFTGYAHVQKAVIAGHFDGQLIVDGLLHVKSSAVITGEIRYAQLQVESGAAVSGQMICTATSSSTAANGAEVDAKRVLNVENLFKASRHNTLRTDIPRAPKRAKSE